MDDRFLLAHGKALLTGNEAIVKGALEAGVSLITGYPGSPISDVFETVSTNSSLLKTLGVHADIANNEALAAARLNGARMAGARAMAVMKSVGMHVAADGLALGNLSEPRNEGGCVVVVGDDPWIESTQINNDSRYLSQHLHMPVIEPSTFQELKDWVEVAFVLSSECDLYFTYLVSTHQADGGGTVTVHPNRPAGVSVRTPMALDTAALSLENTVLLPPRTWRREASLPARFERVFEATRRYELNRLHHARKAPLGFISAGLSYADLTHALAEAGLGGVWPILQLGITYPVDPKAVLALASQVEMLIVVEPKRGFVEAQVADILRHAERLGEPMPSVWGKELPNNRKGFPETRGLNGSLILEVLGPLLRDVLADEPELAQRLQREIHYLEETGKGFSALPVRTPTFCPGCPHRDSSSVFLEIKRDFMDSAYMRRQHQVAPVDLVFHGETGCITMLMFEPNKSLMHNYSGMGLGGGTGAGLDPFITNKQIVFLGDSTFFHSGMNAISDSLQHGQDITYIILDNGTTAMTGHQPTPGGSSDLLGNPTPPQNIAAIVRALSLDRIPVTRINPSDHSAYRRLLEETVLKEGVKVVIADKECAITAQRRARRTNVPKADRFIHIAQQTCEYCLECTRSTGCPGLTVEATAYGPKIATHASLCVNDSACLQTHACPAFEEVRVVPGSAAKQERWPAIHLPTPAVASTGDLWQAVIAGVGGMGAGLLSAVLAGAAHREGWRVVFWDKKGLAVRNGSVFSYVQLMRDERIRSPQALWGRCDLLLGLDLLEASRAADPNHRVAHASRTQVITNANRLPTVRMLIGEDGLNTAGFEAQLRRRASSYWAEDVTRLAEHHFGSAQYVNMLLLGVAAQRGALPFHLDSLMGAIAECVPSQEIARNQAAFTFGRQLVAEPLGEMPPLSSDALVSQKAADLRNVYGRVGAWRYEQLTREAIALLNLDEEAHLDFARRAGDLIAHSGVEALKRYIEALMAIAGKDDSQRNWQATRRAIRSLFKVMAVKDEIYVAHLLTSPEKYRQDRLRFETSLGAQGRLSYRHFNRLEFTLLGKTFQWDLRTRDWQLNILKHMRFLRRIIPGWHREEQQFRDWFLGVARQFSGDTEASYDIWLKILEAPEDVRGYRQIRRPRMAQARQRIEVLLEQAESASLERPLSTSSPS